MAFSISGEAFMNLETFQRVIKQNSSTIISTGAVAGVILTAVLTHRAAIKARNVLDMAEIEKNSPVTPDETPELKTLTNREKLEKTWKIYIPPMAAGLTTIGCIIWSNQVGLRRQAALIAAYGVAETAFREYKDQVVEVLGEKNHQKVTDAVAAKRLDENPPNASNTVIVTGGGDVRCYDMWSGRYFQSDIETIRQKVNELNTDILQCNMYAELNQFYVSLGMAPVDGGEYVGWNVDNQCDVVFTSHLSEDGKPALAVTFKNLPKADFGKCF
jgi:hypothetical protein